MARILSTKVLKSVENINDADEWDLTPLHYLVLFNEDMPETVLLLRHRGADFLRRSSYIKATPFQLLMRGNKATSCIALATAAAESNPSMSIQFMSQVMAGGQADFDNVNLLLENRLRVLKQREEDTRKWLRAEFDV